MTITRIGPGMLAPDLIEQIRPAGELMPYSGGDVPAGWAYPVGQEVDAETWPVLHAKLVAAGNPYGTTGGNPRAIDMRGRLFAFRDNMGGSAAGRITDSGTGNPGIDGETLGATGGADRISLTTAQLPVHQATTVLRVRRDFSGGGSSSNTAYTPADSTVGTNVGDTNKLSNNIGSGQAHPNMPPVAVVDCLMKVH